MKIFKPTEVTDAILVSSNVPENEHPAYDATKVYATGTRVLVVSANVHKVYESLTGSSSSVTITIASPAVISWTAHGRAAGDPVSFTTTGALPTGLVAGTVYYVLAPTANSFNVAATPGGVAINTTGTQSGIHTATSSINFNKPPALSPTVWLDVGATNRWKMFDKGVQTQTTNMNTIDVSFQTVGYTDSVAVLNVSAASVRVVMTHPVDGVVYDQTVIATSASGINNWYQYFFTPIQRRTDITFFGLPLYAGVMIQVIVTDTGNVAKVGALLFGKATDISSSLKGVELGAKVGIQSYDIKQRDSFGNFTILERSFNKRADFTIHMNNAQVDNAINLLASFRATPCVYIGGGVDSTTIYGFYKDFNIDIAYPTMSICTIQLEGLT